MEYLLIIFAFAVLIAIGWWLSLRECGACGEKIYPNQESYGVSPPSSCDIHAECSIAFHKKLREEPYKSILEDYNMMLDRQCRHKEKTGRPLNKEEWEGYKERRREKLTWKD